MSGSRSPPARHSSMSLARCAVLKSSITRRAG
jgi:hypothetical protein